MLKRSLTVAPATTRYRREEIDVMETGRITSFQPRNPRVRVFEFDPERGYKTYKTRFCGFCRVGSGRISEYPMSLLSKTGRGVPLAC